MSRYIAVPGREADYGHQVIDISQSRDQEHSDTELEAAFNDDEGAEDHLDLTGPERVYTRLMTYTRRSDSQRHAQPRNPDHNDDDGHESQVIFETDQPDLPSPYRTPERRSSNDSQTSVLAAGLAAPDLPGSDHAALGSTPSTRYNPHDGVFANLSAKPDRQADLAAKAEEKHPPSYEQAAADATPPYWETTVIANSLEGNGPGGYPFGSGPDDPVIDGLPVGNMFAFVWNLLVSMSFQFVGFLLTHLLYTTHAAKQGSRAGLGITLVQYGYYLKSRQPGEDDDTSDNLPMAPEPDDLVGPTSMKGRQLFSRAFWNRKDISTSSTPSTPDILEVDNSLERYEQISAYFESARHYEIPENQQKLAQTYSVEPVTLSSPSKFESGALRTMMVRAEPGSIATYASQDGQSLSSSNPEVVAYILMIAGWAILLRSVLEYWRVRKMGSVLVMTSTSSETSSASVWADNRISRLFQRWRQQTVNTQ